MYDEHDKGTNKVHSPYTFNPTGEVKIGSIYDADAKTTAGIERMVAGQKKKDAFKQKIVDTIVQNFPTNSNDLQQVLGKTGYRLDLMKKLVDSSRNHFFTTAKKYLHDYSPEANEIVNRKMSEYLCLIETLKSSGYNFGSTANSYSESTVSHQFDPYKPDVMMQEVMSMMFLRRKNGASIDIPYPVNYNLEDIDQAKIDAVTAASLVDKHLKNNPNMAFLWKKAGYGSIENETGRSR